jgi:tetratricopeptide (TPR) repeat protein
MDRTMRRKINYRLLLWLFSGIVVLTGGLFAVHYFQWQRIARALLWQADRAEEQGQTERMARYLTRYREFVPDDRESAARLGKVLAGETFVANFRARRRAVSLLENVLSGDPNRADLRRVLVKAALEIGQYKTARDHLQALLPEDATARAPMTDVERGEVECYWGQLCEAENEPPARAAAWYRAAMRHAPEAETAYIRLAWILRALARQEIEPTKAKTILAEADALLDQLIASNADSAAAYLARWRYRREFELVNLNHPPDPAKVALADAAADVARALQRQPESVKVLLAAAEVERLKFESDHERNPDGRKAARRHLTRGLELQAKLGARANQDPTQFQLLWQLANLLLDERQDDGTPVEARSELEEEAARRIFQLRKVRQRPESTVPAAADFLRARLHCLNGEYALAEPLLTRSRTVLENQTDLAIQINLLLGACYSRLENPVGMLDSYNRVLKVDPNSAPALLGVAAAQWQLGQVDKSLENYRALMKQKAAPPGGWLDIARIEVQKQLQADRSTHKWEDAEAALRQAEAALPDVPARDRPARLFDVTLLRAEVLAAQNRADEAERLLVEARDTQKERRAQYWAALVELAEYRKDRDKAKTLLAEAEKEADTADLRLARARLLAAENPDDLVARLDSLSQEAQPAFSTEDQARLLAGLADVYFRAGNSAKAREYCKRLAANPLHQSDLRLRLFIFDLALRDNAETEMDQALKDIGAVEQGVGPFTRFGTALTLIRRARQPGQKEKARLLDEAWRELDKVAEARPYWSKLAVARADICEQRGQPELVIEELRKAVAAGEGSPAVVGKLVATLNDRQRYQEASQELQKARPLLQANADLRRLAASLALWHDKPVEALEHARKAVESESTNFRDLVWLGQMLDATNKTDEGVKKLRRAIELAPADPAPYVALVQTVAGRGRESEAVALIKEVETKIDPQRRALALAQCYEAVNDSGKTRHYYDAALESRPGDMAVVRAVILHRLRTNRLESAEQVLRRVVRGEVDASDADRAWARQALALVLANGTDYARFQEALELAGVKIDKTGQLVRETGRPVRVESTEAILTRARVLATQPIRAFRERAIELFEDLDRSLALTPNDKLILALLYEAAGQWPKAQSQLDYLVAQYPGVPQFLAQYVQLLLRHDDPRRGEAELKKLEELEKKREAGTNAYATEDLRALLLEKTGKKDEAVELIRRTVGRPGAPPEGPVVLIAALARTEKYAEAFALCEQTWDKWPDNKVPPEALGAATVSLLRSMRPTDDQMGRLEKCLKNAIKHDPERTVLRMHLADLYDLRGRYREAEALYREVLAKEPNNAIALNNLAWLLSQERDRQDEALTLITRAVQGYGRRAELLDTQAMVLLKLGRTEEALADLREVTGDVPTAPRLFHLARALHSTRDHDGAGRALKQARALGLAPDKLHPVEQKDCRALLDEYRVQ